MRGGVGKNIKASLIFLLQLGGGVCFFRQGMRSFES